MSDDVKGRQDSLRGLLESYLRSPTVEVLADLEAGLRQYQTQWITARAEGAAAPAAQAKVAAALVTKATRLSTSDQTVLERMADGWIPTTAEVVRWVWFEDRGLVSIDKGPAGSDRAALDCLYLTPAGYQAIGRPVPARAS